MTLPPRKDSIQPHGDSGRELRDAPRTGANIAVKFTITLARSIEGVYENAAHWGSYGRPVRPGRATVRASVVPWTRAHSRVTSEMHTPESCFPGVASQGHVAGNNDQRGDSEHAYHNGNRRLKKNAALQDAASWRTE